MFQQLFERSHALQRQLTSPLLEERIRYLGHCAQQGSVRRTLREIATYLLVVVRYLRLTDQRKVSQREIEAATARWAQHQSKLYPRKGSFPRWSKARFRRYAVRWLSFLGWLEIPLPPPIAPEVAAFIDYMRQERGLCEETIEGRRHSVERLLDQMGRCGYSLDRLTLAHVDTFLLERYRQGPYAPRTIQTQASGLRAFFRYAESRRWCRPGISCGIQAPRVYRHASLPSSPTWEEVQRLLKTTEGNHPTDIRDRAILLLLAVYGLRAGEVGRLRLADLDWERETLTITHNKNDRLQQFPLTKVVGQAVLRYLREVRPRSEHREVFLSMRAPIRPLPSGALFQLVNRRMKSLHLPIMHHGPHALRHACATRLINCGISLKAIADQLGHRNLETTRIYAKVDLTRLREVANFRLGGVL
jgi:integrase/recombinase XerD